MSISNESTKSLNASGDDDHRVRKTRNRVPTSCSVCRRRKMKCDKQRPFCSSCVKNGTTELCAYKQQPWEHLSTEKQLSNEIVKLKMKINQLEKNLRDADLNETPESKKTVTTTGSDTQEEDPIFELSSKFDSLIIKENKLMHFGTTSFMAVPMVDPMLHKVFENFLLKHKQIYMEYMELLSDNKTMMAAEEKLEGHIENGSEFCFGNDRSFNAKRLETRNMNAQAITDGFTDPINAILPTFENISILVDNFFVKCYSLLPYIDEESFKNELKLFLFKEESTGKAYLKCFHPSLLADVAILLIILRLSYLTLPLKEFYSDTSLINDSKLLKLCSNKVVIPEVFIDHAKNCIFNAPDDSNFSKKITFRGIQSLLFLKLYGSYCPESDDDGSDSSLLLSTLIQMSRMHGMYRDPGCFQDVINDPKVRHLWRKIWYELLYLDCCKSIQSGSPLIISDDMWDCELPFLEMNDKLFLDEVKNNPGCLNEQNKDRYEKLVIEKQIIKSCEIKFRVTKLYREVCNLLNGIKSQTRRSDFSKIIQKAEKLLKNDFKSFKELEEDPRNKDVYYKMHNIVCFMMRIQILTARYILNYLMILSEDDESYINSSFNNLYNEESSSLAELTEDSLILFKLSFDFVSFISENQLSTENDANYFKMNNLFSEHYYLISSCILVASTRSLQFLTSLTLRYNFNFFSFTSIIRSFSNSDDSVDVIKWFNISLHNLTTNVDVSLDKQFNIMLFQYIKVFYYKCSQMDNKFFQCFRLTMIIKLFINHLKYTYPDKYNLLSQKYSFNPLSMGVTENEDNNASAYNNDQIAEKTTLDNETSYKPEFLTSLIDSVSNANTLMDDITFENEDEFLNAMISESKMKADNFFDTSTTQSLMTGGGSNFFAAFNPMNDIMAEQHMILGDPSGLNLDKSNDSGSI
ncbi:hypothetical protein PACTADRAFT_50407 [Pachysolen tannophilus NRRL Y-2460]|uniref:Zn(2)-C6 fungal-type domain-containing protein n=1 Tax=Pachysolen tannophilus NRRL Y-2460 TaxID=669874 RepID=A0A1E4TS02_PACTA|nr:hypothetical protein PACTADRAFT_50407 [Pachysolen tannophilus NRRL Y-2460]